VEQAKSLGIMTAGSKPANDENGELLSRSTSQVCQVCDVFSDQWNPAFSKS